jgi:tRNA(adenine34) deaminase
MNKYNWHMNIALEEAEKAFRLGEVPIGAIIIDKNGIELARAHNIKEQSFDPTGHAEILCIREATKNIKNWRLQNCTIFVSLEPCPMCLYAIQQARISKLVFGAYDKKGGALSLNYKFNSDSRLNHKFDVIGGIKHFESSKILSTFFKQRRK